jgi:hypothetical protein
MNAPRIGPRDRRALLLAAVVLIPVFGYTQAVTPFVAALSERRATLASERGLLERELSLLAESASYQGRMAGARKVLENHTRLLLPGSSPLSASGELVRHVGRLARDHRVHVDRAGTLAEEPASGALLAIGVELRGQSDLEGLLGFVRELEAGPYLLSVPTLTIERGTRYSRPGTDEEVLSFSATVVGYVLTDDLAEIDRDRLITAAALAGGDR